MEGRDHLGDPEINGRMDRRETESQKVKWINLPQDRSQWLPFSNHV